jgi:hypothetical protein
MFKQKMHNQGLDGIFDKVHTLINNQGEWRTESCKINSYKNLVVTDVMFVYNALASTHLVT